MRRWVRVALGVSMGCLRGVVLRLTRRTRRTKGLTMGTIEHWWLITVPGISVLASSVLARSRRSCIWTIHSRSRDERSLRGDGMEQTLLIESDAVLASSVGRAIVA